MLRPPPHIYSAPTDVAAAVTTRPLADQSGKVEELMFLCSNLVPCAGELYGAIISTTDGLDPAKAPGIAPLIRRLGSWTFERALLPYLDTQRAEGFPLALARAYLDEETKASGDEAVTCRRLAERLLSPQIDKYEPIPAELPSQLNGHRASPPSVENAWELFTLILDSREPDALLDKLYARLEHLLAHSPTSTSPLLAPSMVKLCKDTGAELDRRDMVAQRESATFTTFAARLANTTFTTSSV